MSQVRSKRARPILREDGNRCRPHCMCTWKHGNCLVPVQWERRWLHVEKQQLRDGVSCGGVHYRYGQDSVTVYCCHSCSGGCGYLLKGKALTNRCRGIMDTDDAMRKCAETAREKGGCGHGCFCDRAVVKSGCPVHDRNRQLPREGVLTPTRAADDILTRLTKEVDSAYMADVIGDYPDALREAMKEAKTWLAVKEENARRATG